MEIGDITIMPCTVMKNMRIIQYSSTKLIWGGKARIQGIVEDVKKNIYIYTVYFSAFQLEETYIDDGSLNCGAGKIFNFYLPFLFPPFYFFGAEGNCLNRNSP
jgi:hypothetical protein